MSNVVDSQMCDTCAVDLPLHEFHRQQSNTLGFRLTCKSCMRKRGIDARAAGIKNGSVQACIDCKLELPLTEFSPNDGKVSGVQSVCKPCNSERTMKWNDANYERGWDTRLRRNFGVTLAQYKAMLAEQGDVCAICGKPPAVVGYRASRRQGRPTRPILVVDHNHETGKVRGLLCIHCNRGIGFLGDDPDRVRFALKYLEERA